MRFVLLEHLLVRKDFVAQRTKIICVELSARSDMLSEATEVIWCWDIGSLEILGDPFMGVRAEAPLPLGKRFQREDFWIPLGDP